MNDEIFEIGHSDTTLSDWETFKTTSMYFFSKVVDRCETQLPDEVLPLARGVAFPSDALLRTARYHCGRHRPHLWEYFNDCVREKWGRDWLYAKQFGDLWAVSCVKYQREPEWLQVLVFRFGHTPIVTHDYSEAMHLAKRCISHPPSGLCWIPPWPPDRHLAIERARERRIREALAHLASPQGGACFQQ
jgi:hypothetical protein